MRAFVFLSQGEVRRGFDNSNVHFFFFISTKKEKVEPKKKNTNDQMVRVIRGYAPEPPIQYDYNRAVIPNIVRNLYPNASARDPEMNSG